MWETLDALLNQIHVCEKELQCPQDVTNLVHMIDSCVGVYRQARPCVGDETRVDHTIHELETLQKTLSRLVIGEEYHL